MLRNFFTDANINTAIIITIYDVAADELGLHITDHKCLDLINRFGAMPAGRLAGLTGLTTGAVTGVIDRLEEAGYVRRVEDPNDRRRTIVGPTGNRKLERKIESMFFSTRGGNA
jgi:DNA-binding MarR family transcriptional regulator